MRKTVSFIIKENRQICKIPLRYREFITPVFGRSTPASVQIADFWQEAGLIFSRRRDFFSCLCLLRVVDC